MPSTSQQQQGGKQGGQGGAQDSSQQTPPRRLERSNAKVERNQAQVGALLRTTAKRDLLSETKDERESWLLGQKDGVVKDLVDAAVKKLADNLGAKMTKVVAAQKAQILETARVAVKASLELRGETGASDIKPETLVAESDAWDAATAVATDTAKAMVGDAQRDALTTAADGAFVVASGASLKTADRQKHLEKVAAEAKKLIDAKAKQLETTLTADVENQRTKDRLIAGAKTKAGNAAAKDIDGEVDARQDSDAKVEAAVKEPVEKTAKEIRSETKTYLEKGLGAHGTGWFRSTQFKAFHAKMKGAAREKGHAMTDGAITEKRGSGGAAPGHKAELEYQTAQAHLLTHDAAKLELREIMGTFAGELLDQASTAVNIESPLHASGSAAAWAVLRNDPTKQKNETAAAKAAASAVKAAKPEVLEKLHGKAQELKNAYVKADITSDPNAQTAKNNDVIANKVDKGFDEREKDGEKFGKRMLRQAMEAPTAGKGLQMIGKLIDLATPQVGDETTLEVELKIPATHGAFCYVNVKGSALRSTHMELGIEVGFGAGWETWGLSARGGFNVFLKAAAHDTVNAMQLIHYGAFRNLTHVSDSAANFWAGVSDPKKTAGKHENEIGRTEQAELWAAMTEERVFGKDKDAFVEVGGGISAGAKLKAGIGGEVTGGLTSALRWDKAVFDNVHTEDNEHGAGLMGDRVGKDRDGRKQLATEKRELVAKHVKRMNRFQFGTSLEAEANGQKFAVGLEAKHTFGPTGGWEIAAKGAIPYDSSSPSSSTLLSKIASSYVPAAIAGVKKIYDLYKHNKPGQGTVDQGGSDKTRIAGGLLDTGEDLTGGLDAGGMTGDLFKKLSEANPQNLVAGESDGVNDTARLWLGKNLGMNKIMGENGDMSKATSALGTASPFGATTTLEVALNIEVPNAQGEKPKFAFKVTKAKELRAGGELGGGVGLTAKLTRKQELGGVAYKSGEGFNAFTGGREGFVSTGLGGGGGNP